MSDYALIPRTMCIVTTLPSEILRATALEQAVNLFTPVGPVPFWTDNTVAFAVINIADLFLDWLRSGGTPFTVRLVVGAPQAEDDNSTSMQKGHAIMAAMNTGQKIQLTADPEDAAGFDVDVPVDFTVTDENVATIVDIPEEPKSVWIVSGAPGSTVVTATVTNLAGETLSGTLAVDVVSGDVAVVNIVAGDPVPE